MAVIRVNKTANYTVMSNYHFKDKRLSLKAKGLLSQMLSLPDSWDYTVAGLCAINKENESAITSALKELKESGYLNVEKIMPDKTKSGRIEYVYDIYEHPQEKQEVEKQEVEKQGVENLGLEIQGIENQGQLNTKQSKTKVLNTKDKYTDGCDSVIDYLNEVCGTNYRHAESTRNKIMPRLKEGFTVDECKSVIDKKAKEWKGTEWEKYLTPDTLFRPSNFEKYLNQKINKSSRIQSVPEYMKQAKVQQDQDDDKDDLINEIREMQERMKKGC